MKNVKIVLVDLVMFGMLLKCVWVVCSSEMRLSGNCFLSSRCSMLSVWWCSVNGFFLLVGVRLMF